MQAIRDRNIPASVPKKIELEELVVDICAKIGDADRDWKDGKARGFYFQAISLAVRKVIEDFESDHGKEMWKP